MAIVHDDKGVSFEAFPINDFDIVTLTFGAEALSMPGAYLIVKYDSGAHSLSILNEVKAIDGCIRLYLESDEAALRRLLEELETAGMAA
jgi:hypothetical protein